VIKISVMLTAV